MGFRCVPQITGLVRDEPQPGQKHRANGKAILGELGEERHSASLTLDKSRSHLNEFTGYTSGFECWDALTDAADAFRVKVNTKNGVRERKLPPDAVIGWAMIANPPAEMTVGWDAAKYAKFFEDTQAVMAEIVPDLFRPENVRMTALHKDEGYMDDQGEYGWNLHVVGVPMGRNGRYCGNLIDAKRCVQICQDFPRMMRAKNWDLDDLDMTDFLTLMVAMFQNQDIDNAASTTDMMNQMVQMTVVQAITNISTLIDDSTVLTYAASLVGKEVTIGQYINGELKEIVGTVTGTGTLNGQQVVFIGDDSYYLNDIMAVGRLPEKKEDTKPGDEVEKPGEGEDVEKPGEGGEVEKPDETPGGGETGGSGEAGGGEGGTDQP